MQGLDAFIGGGGGDQGLGLGMLAYGVVTCESSYCLVFAFGASFLPASTALATACFTASDTTAFTVCARAPARCPAPVHSKQPCTDGNQEHCIVLHWNQYLDDCTVYYVCPLPQCDSYTTYSGSLLDCRALTLWCPPFTCVRHSTHPDSSFPLKQGFCKLY